MSESHATSDAPSPAPALVVAAATAATAAAPSTSPPPPVAPRLDLSAVTPEQVVASMPTADWLRGSHGTFAHRMVALPAELAMGVFVAYSNLDDGSLATRLNDMLRADVKKLCTHIGVHVGSKSSTVLLVQQLTTTVAQHGERFSHLAVGFDPRALEERMRPAQAAESTAADNSSTDASDTEGGVPTPPRARGRTVPAPASPVRTPRSRKAKQTKKDSDALAAAHAMQHAALRQLSSSKSKSASGSVAIPDSAVLRALASLPARPPSDHDHASSDEEGHAHGRRRKTSGGKRKKSHGAVAAKASKSRRRHDSTEEEVDDDDSDSDGPSTKHRKHKKKRTRAVVATSSSSSSSSSSDSSSCSSSDSDSGSDSGFLSSRSRRRGIFDGMEKSGIAKPLAKKWLRNLFHAAGGSARSVLSVYKEHEFKSTRSQREVHCLARVIDLLLSKKHDAALETIVRRLVGVETADSSGNWKLCDAFELITERQSFVPDVFLAHALKSVKRIEALEGAAAGSRQPKANARAKTTSTGRRSDDATKGDHRHGRNRSTSRGPPSSSTADQPGEKGSSTGSRRRK
jgi:hypothetical protein